jgi:Zn-dependent peptidase ImmA (M78 family)
MHNALWGRGDDIEKEAEDFAGEFLLPEDAMRREIVPPVTLVSLAELKPRWQVSIGSLIERAYKLNIIKLEQRKYLWKQMSMKKWKEREPENLDIEPERPRALRKMAELLYSNKDGSINYQKLARDTSMPIVLVAQILDVHSPYNTVATMPPGQLMEFPKKTAKSDDAEAALESVG